MSRRRGRLEESFDNTDDDNGTNLATSQKPKKRRRTDQSTASNDSGIQSAPVTSPSNEFLESEELTDCLNQFQNLPPAAGILKRIRLKNFMCHANLEVELDKNVSFITGRNGSGKSAILAALVLGLGGKPSSLNRGNSVKEYIRNGCVNAEISITFNNEGGDAYRPKDYGKELTIERILTNKGGSRYRTKNAQGVVVGNRFEEITVILRYLNFQLENPVMILTQDTARTFLNQCQPKKLFELFYRGTQLQKMDDDFDVVLETQQIAHLAIERRRTIIDELKTDLAKVENQIRIHEDAQANRLRLKFVAHELAWAKHRDAKAELERIRSTASHIQERLDRASELFEAAKALEMESDAQIAEESAALQEISTRVRTLRENVGVAQDRFDGEHRREKEKKMTCSKIEREINHFKDEVAQATEYIRKEQDKEMDDENKQLRDAKEAEKDRLVADRPRMAASLESHKGEKVQWDNSLRQHEQERDTMRMELNGVTNRMEASYRRYKNFESAQSNAMARFGQETPRLLQLIEEATRRGQFHRRPLGPIGSYVSVKDQRWAVAIETCISKGTLGSYIVHDFHDNRLLEDLIARAGYHRYYKPSTFVRNFGNNETVPFDVSRNETRSQKYPNVLSQVEINDTFVRNLLIDVKKLETAILFEDEREMRDTMQYRPIQNSSVAYDILGGQAHPPPKFRYYPNNGRGGAQILIESVEEQLHIAQDEYNRLNEQKTRLQNEKAELERQVSNDQRESNRCLNVINKLQQQMQVNNRRIENLVDELRELLPTTVNIDLVRKEIRENEEKLARCEEELQRAIEEYRAQKVVAGEAKTELDERKSGEATTLNELRTHQRTIDRLVSEKAVRKNDAESKRRAFESINQQIATNENVVGQHEEKEKKTLDDAKELCEEPIETDRLYEVIDREMRKLESGLRRFEQMGSCLDALRAERQQKLERHGRLEGYLNEIVNTSQTLDRAVSLRRGGYRTIRMLTKLEVKNKFITNMSGRHYSGKLDISYEHRTLTIFVDPREGAGATRDAHNQRRAGTRRPTQGISVDADSDRVQDLRGLSGGERSFSTVSFILSLWETMNTPCCCLDEFDVFMDSYSRRVIMELLILFALRTRPTNQFIFFTPLSLSELPLNCPGLKVLQLESPRDGRRQENDENENRP